MEDNLEKYGLDLHCTMILEEYREALPLYRKMQQVATDSLKKCIDENGIYLNAIESRIKTEKSLAGKLELKGGKYNFLSDLTDILGVRVITFYLDEVDKISALVDRLFDVDWDNSVDKRKMHELDSFGYNSLHYICSIPKSLYEDPEHPEVNTLRFEIQMRTALQHVWATMNHDTGYKSGFEVPREYLRNLNRLAGMLELADEQFSTIRTNLNDYRRQVQSLVAGGRFDDVHLDGDSFSSYLKLRPFDRLLKKIAAINQAEVHESSLMPYLNVLKDLHFETLGDVERLIADYSDDAYSLAVYEIGNTDLDIISSTVALQDLCIVYLLKKRGGAPALKHMFDILGGRSEYNGERAARIVATASQLPFMKSL